MADRAGMLGDHQAWPQVLGLLQVAVIMGLVSAARFQVNHAGTSGGHVRARWGRIETPG